MDPKEETICMDVRLTRQPFVRVVKALESTWGANSNIVLEAEEGQLKVYPTHCTSAEVVLAATVDMEGVFATSVFGAGSAKETMSKGLTLGPANLQARLTVVKHREWDGGKPNATLNIVTKQGPELVTKSVLGTCGPHVLAAQVYANRDYPEGKATKETDLWTPYAILNMETNNLLDALESINASLWKVRGDAGRSHLRLAKFDMVDGEPTVVGLSGFIISTWKLPFSTNEDFKDFMPMGLRLEDVDTLLKLRPWLTKGVQDWSQISQGMDWEGREHTVLECGPIRAKLFDIETGGHPIPDWQRMIPEDPMYCDHEDMWSERYEVDLNEMAKVFAPASVANKVRLINNDDGCRLEAKHNGVTSTFSIQAETGDFDPDIEFGFPDRLLGLILPKRKIYRKLVIQFMLQSESEAVDDTEATTPRMVNHFWRIQAAGGRCSFWGIQMGRKFEGRKVAH